MKPKELADLLEVLEKHPRVVEIAIGKDDAGKDTVNIKMAEAYVIQPEAQPGEEGAQDELALPEGVIDPRARIREIYRKAGLQRDGKVPS